MGVLGDVPENISALADECESRLLKVCTPKYCWVTAQIDGRYPITLTGYKLMLNGNDISDHLDGCFGVALLCATIGSGADDLLRRVQSEDMAKALVCDALASAAVEQVCDEAENEIRSRFPDKFTTWRFSPGYGDFPIDCQKDFLAAVNAQRAVGVCLSGGGLLTPTKSVTAVIGLSDSPVSAKRRGCASCAIREKCLYRKNGGHCGE